MSKEVLLALAILVGCTRRKPIEASNPRLEAIARMSDLDMRWSYDPASHLLAVANESGQPGLLLIDTQHPDAHRTVSTTARWPHHPLLSPGARWLAFEDRPPNTEPSSLYLIDLTTGTERTVFRSSTVPQASEEYREFATFSPDVTALLYEVRNEIVPASDPEQRQISDGLRIYDLLSGSTHTLLDSPTAIVRGPTWGFDGNIYFASKDSLKRIPATGGTAEVLASVPDASLVEGDGDSVAINDDATAAAFTVQLDGCIRIALVTLKVEPGYTLLDCGFHPSFRRGAQRQLLYIGYPKTGSRVPRIYDLASRQSQSLGFEPGVTSEISSDANGDIFALAATPTMPRAVWRIIPGGPPPSLVYAPFDTSLTQNAGGFEQRYVRSKDGMRVPVLVFESACTRDRSPLVLFLHGGHNDTTPRWTREIQFLTHAGVTVAAVNVRGSSGYGADYRYRPASLDAQVEDARAALRDVLALRNVDSRRVLVLSVSSANSLESALIAADPGSFAGAINWVSSPSPFLGLPGSLERLPPMLWLSGIAEPGAETFDRVVDQLRKRKLRIERVLVNDDHTLRTADATAAALERVRLFLIEHASAGCDQN